MERWTPDQGKHGGMEAWRNGGRTGPRKTWRNGDMEKWRRTEENIEAWRLDVWIFGSLIFPDVLVFQISRFLRSLDTQSFADLQICIFLDLPGQPADRSRKPPSLNNEGTSNK